MNRDTRVLVVACAGVYLAAAVLTYVRPRALAPYVAALVLHAAAEFA